MEFINIKVLRYAGNQGNIQEVKMNLNVDAIAFAEEIDANKATFRIIGDASLYTVVDPVSLRKLLEATHE